MDFLSQKHEVTVYTSNAIKLDSFWNNVTEEPINNYNYNDKKYQIRRYPIVLPSRISEDLYKFPFSIGSPGPFCPDMWHDLLNLEEKPDLIIATAFPYNHIIPSIIAAKKYDIPIIMIPHLHLEFPELYLTGLRITLLHASDLIVVNTETEKKVLLKYAITENKIHVIPPAITIQYNIGSSNLREKLNINSKSLIVLFAGTKSSAKGTIYLIEAMKKLWDKSHEFDLILIGQPTKDYKEYLEKQDKRHLVHIHDLGLVSDKEKWDAFLSCDIFALPSKSESFGISYLEAWLNKKPVIGCDIDAIKDVIDDGINGILVEFGNTDELFLTFEKLKDSKLRDRLGESGFKKLLDRYGLEKACNKFEELCTSISRSR